MSALASDRCLNLQATELCLGLPGGKKKMVGDHQLVVDQAVAPKASGSKRGYQETVDLKLNLEPAKEEGGHGHAVDLNQAFNGDVGSVANGNEAVHSSKDKALLSPAKPPAKAQVVGWPPVRSYRKNMMSQKNSSSPGEGDRKGISSGTSIVNGGAAFVKVCMDGAPYLRKVDLKMYKSYQDLSDSLAMMFSSFTMGNYNGAQGMIDFMNEGKLMDLLNSSEYVPTYEDKDGDWMLVGDVPWEMFVDSCKRLRIMKGSEAIGLAPRAMEKCKSRT